MVVGLASATALALVAAAVTWGRAAPEARPFEIFLVAIAVGTGGALIGAARRVPAALPGYGPPAMLVGVLAAAVAVVSGLGALVAGAAKLRPAALATLACLIAASASVAASSRERERGEVWDAWTSGPPPVVGAVIASLALGLTCLFLVAASAAVDLMDGEPVAHADVLPVVGAVAALAVGWAGALVVTRPAPFLHRRWSVVAIALIVAGIAVGWGSVVGRADLREARAVIGTREARCDASQDAGAAPAPLVDERRRSFDDRAARLKASCIDRARALSPWSGAFLALASVALLAVAAGSAAVASGFVGAAAGSRGSAAPAET